MAFARVREVINKEYGNWYVIPTQDVENFSEQDPPFLKYIMKINDERRVGIVKEVHDDEEKLKTVLNQTKRLSRGTPSLARCQTKPDLSRATELKLAQSDKENKKVIGKQPKIIKTEILKDNHQLIDITKIKKEIVESKKKKSPPLPTSAPVTQASVGTNKRSFDLLSAPAKPNIPKKNTEKPRVIAPSKNKVFVTSTPVKSSSAPTPMVRTPTKEIQNALTPIKSTTATLTSVQTKKKNVISSNPNYAVSRSSTDGNPINSSFERDESFRGSENLESDLRAQLREKGKVIAKQAKKIDELEKSIKNKDDIWLELSRATIDVQKEVINNHKQLFDIVRGLKQAHKNTADPNGSFLAVGYLDKRSLMVHVGKDQWMPQTEYNYGFSLVCPKEFVRHMALKLIGEEVLKQSTVTGKPSNRSKKSDDIGATVEEDESDKNEDGVGQKKKTNTGRKKWAALDPLKIQAITDSLDHFLKLKKFGNISTEEKMMHVRSVRSYLSGFIADLKKPNGGVKDTLTKKRRKNNEADKNSKSNKRSRKNGKDSEQERESADGERNKNEDNSEDDEEMENKIASEGAHDTEDENNHELENDDVQEEGDLSDGTRSKRELLTGDLFLEEGEVKTMILGKNLPENEDENSSISGDEDTEDEENTNSLIRDGDKDGQEEETSPGGDDPELIDDTQFAGSINDSDSHDARDSPVVR
ncbi:hypothetical protein QAD02_020545 [Eretmocerus hayati]|uniref:Uncharacterized protein n=1 Tax=Eretmocerus hayati TaxID=131215 RepID=A0ACC2PMW7_9HYME|nr:hypothetical protein QAD02_020545 [Eretmocerus hayati]